MTASSSIRGITRRIGSDRRFRPASVILLGMLSVGLLLRIRQGVDPGDVWGDHVFYRAQAISWLGLDEANNYLSPSTRAHLERYYIEYYYDDSNGLAGQPPYVYRVALPLLAGAVAHAVGVNSAFWTLNAVALAVMAIACGLAALRLTGALSAAWLTALVAAWIPGISGVFPTYFALVDPATFAIVAVTLLLTVRGQFVSAILLAGVGGALTKETLLPLALCVAVAAFFVGRGSRALWVLAAVPFAITVALRLLIPVMSSPELSEMFQSGHPYLALHFLIDGLGLAVVLAVGLVSSSVRPWIMAFIPLFLFIAVINSSTVSAGDRIWLTVWPIILVLGVSGLRMASPSQHWWAAWAVLVFGAVAGSFLVLDGRLARPAETVILLLAGIVAFVFYARGRFTLRMQEV